ncbi:MAG: hypothetical protein CBARDCOR_2799 [uncultured Caballeronia sp.]|nr:MAG: hypothetical protein CBARDCOR_2799 [uncultured Caballeronia sp.]
MSKRTNSAPLHRAQIKVLAKQPSQEAAPRKTIVSALSVLVGTGVATLAFGSPEAHAKSAVDELDWVSGFRSRSRR